MYPYHLSTRIFREVNETTETSLAVKVSFTVNPGLLEEFDTAIKEAHYSSRSAAITEAMRDLVDKIKRRAKR